MTVARRKKKGASLEAPEGISGLELAVLSDVSCEGCEGHVYVFVGLLANLVPLALLRVPVWLARLPANVPCAVGRDAFAVAFENVSAIAQLAVGRAEVPVGLFECFNQ